MAQSVRNPRTGCKCKQPPRYCTPHTDINVDSATEQPTLIQSAIAAEDETNNTNKNPPKYR